MTEFKAGDYIVCVSTTEPEWFTVGRVYFVCSKDGMLFVIDDEEERNNWLCCGGNNFELASEYEEQHRKESMKKQEINVGDVVLYTGDVYYHLSEGKMYDVTDVVSHEGKIYYEVPDDHGDFVIVDGRFLEVVVEINGKKYNLEDVVKVIENGEVNEIV